MAFGALTTNVQPEEISRDRHEFLFKDVRGATNLNISTLARLKTPAERGGKDLTPNQET